jgi:hypothetical protein
MATRERTAWLVTIMHVSARFSCWPAGRRSRGSSIRRAPGIHDDIAPLTFAKRGLPQATSEHASHCISMCTPNALYSGMTDRWAGRTVLRGSLLQFEAAELPVRSLTADTALNHCGQRARSSVLERGRKGSRRGRRECSGLAALRLPTGPDWPGTISWLRTMPWMRSMPRLRR